MIFLKLALYASIGVVLSVSGISARHNWQFWVILAGVCVIDFISGAQDK